MNLKKILAISITIVAIAIIYLFLLVGMPALTSLITPCSDNSSEIVDSSAISNVTANWTPVGPALDFRPYSVKQKTPLVIYLLPGLIGFYAIVVIIRQKKEAKNE